MKPPEKIYLEAIYPDNGVLPNGLNYTPSPTDIEYIRKDAFVEKATKWLIDNIQNYTDDGMGEHSFVLVQDLKENFKKYIRGE